MSELEELRAKFPHRFKEPKVAKGNFVAPGAHIYGDVEIQEESSVWFNTVLRGDVNYIRIGKRTNIQDNTLVHVAYEEYPTIIGDDVTVGHSAIIHACEIGSLSLIGMGACILDGAKIGSRVILGAGSLVTQRAEIPDGVLAFGRPAKVFRELTEDEIHELKVSADRYVALAKTYLKRD